MGKSHHSLILFKSVFEKIYRATFGQLVGRSVNFFIPFLLLHLYPPSENTDGFFLAFSISFFFFGTIANIFTDASIPRAVTTKILLNKKIRFCLGGLLAIVGTILVVVANYVNYYPSTFALLLGIAVMISSAIFASFPIAILNAHDFYMWPSILWGLRALPLIIWWAVRPTEHSLGWLMLSLGGMDLLRAYWLERLTHSHIQSIAGYWDSLKGYPSVLVAGMIGGLNPIIDRFIATQASIGGISLLEAGERFYGVLATLSTIGAMNVILVRLSHKSTKVSHEQLYQRVLSLGILWAVGWTLFGFFTWHVGDHWLLKHIISLNIQQSDLVNTIYLYYLAGLPAFVIGLICVRAYLARGWQRSLVLLSLLSAGTNAILSLALFKIIGIAGIALGTTAVYTLITIIMIIHLSYLNQTKVVDKSQSL